MMMRMSELMDEYCGIQGMIFKEVLEAITKTFYEYKVFTSMVMVYT